MSRIASSARHRRVRKWARSDVTLVITALRCGTEPADVCEMASGVNPWRFVAAYRELEKRRAASHAAWMLLVERPTQRTLLGCGGKAAALLPVPVGRLIAMSAAPDAMFAAAVRTEHSRVCAAWDLLDDTIAHLASPAVDTDARIIAARSVFHPDDTGLLGSPTLLPRRVGELSPLRVASLVGDDGAEDD